MLMRVRTNLLPCGLPLTNFRFAHQGGLRNAHALIPHIGLSEQPTHGVASGRKALFLQYWQGMNEVILITVIKSNSHHFSAFLSKQVGLQSTHRQTCVAQQFEPGHLPGKGLGRNIQAPKRAALGRCSGNLVVNQNRNRLAVGSVCF